MTPEDEVRELRAQVRDLASLLMLPAAWRGRGVDEIAAGIPEVLVGLVRGDVAGVVLASDGNARWHPPRSDLVPLAARVASGPSPEVQVVADADGRPTSFARFATACGVAVIGSRRSGFPTRTEEFLLRSAVDQAFGAVTAAELIRKAADADRRKDEFMAMLGHQLRNPLVPIVAALHLMKARDGGAPHRERDIIERHVRHVESLVDELLDVSRIVRGQLKFVKRRVDLRQVVDEAVSVAGPLFDARRQRLSADLGPGPATIAGDPERLAQVVSNLLANASQYTPEGGVVSVRLAAAARAVEIRVRDDGIGIDPAIRDRIFDLFFRGRHDPNASGLGLGLPVVRALVTLHGGTVEVHSDGPGLGSEFVVRLPVGDLEGVDATEAAPEPALPLGRRRVLLVDDNQDGALLLAEVLRDEGHLVRVAHDAPAALDIASSWTFDVALLDLSLPSMDGCELARRLQLGHPPDRVRYVAVTGYGQRSDRERTGRAGFDAHLVKPVDVRALVKLVGAAAPRETWTEQPPAISTSGGQVQGPRVRSAARPHAVVIDDDDTTAEALATLLSTLGYDVVVATSGAGGLDAVLPHRPELVLCDLALPDVDGFEIVQRLRSDPRSAGVRVVAITGYRGMGPSVAEAAGFDHCLVKPIDLAALRAALDARAHG